jgi:hypothetical protein
MAGLRGDAGEPRPRRPRGVRRRVVSASALVIIALLAGIFAFVGELRSPAPTGGAPVDTEAVPDPRTPINCPPADHRRALGADEAVTVSSRALLACPDAYQGRRVRYTGEAVGEVLARGDHAWVQLNDGAYHETGPLPHRPDYAGANSGIGVRLPAGGAERIHRTGGPERRGDVVAVEGRFHRALPDTADAMVIDADRVRRVSAGEPIAQPVRSERRIAALALGVLAAAMVAAERLIARRR